MAWLLRGGQVLASLDVADGFAARLKGLHGRHSREGALLLRHARGVHSLGLGCAIDVAWLDRDLVVVSTRRLRRHSVALPRMRAASVLEAEAGAFDRWALAIGDKLEISD
jgi:uncharacterized membrane protein (UPF0127 family)